MTWAIRTIDIVVGITPAPIAGAGIHWLNIFFKCPSHIGIELHLIAWIKTLCHHFIISWRCMTAISSSSESAKEGVTKKMGVGIGDREYKLNKH
ncbi:hypothetical protein A9Q89_08330 [Gammaproteobacteria bacterium 53_120_T64]|nr:hypothetical protein A9Q89_08330 [Gammaproteobacteria bacterium 53_120_T64]